MLALFVRKPKESFEKAPVKCNQLDLVGEQEVETIVPGDSPIVLVNYGCKSAIIKNLKKAGKAIIFITHKLREVLEVCDRINVLRSGKIVGEELPKKTTNKKLAELMVGRKVNLKTSRQIVEKGEVLLEVNNLSILSENKEP